MTVDTAKLRRLLDEMEPDPYDSIGQLVAIARALPALLDEHDALIAALQRITLARFATAEDLRASASAALTTTEGAQE